MEVLLIIMVRLLNVMEGGLINIEIIDRGLRIFIIIVEIFLGLMLLFIIIDLNEMLRLMIEILRLMIEILRLMIEMLRLMIEILRLINLFLDYISMDDLLFLFYFNKMIKDLI